MDLSHEDAARVKALTSEDVSRVKDIPLKEKRNFDIFKTIIVFVVLTIFSSGAAWAMLLQVDKLAQSTHSRQIINEERITRLEEHEKSIDARLAEIIALLKERKP